jgi:hypothetical protein
VCKLIDACQHDVPKPGTIIGIPWSQEKIDAHRSLLKQSLVKPRLECFILRETYQQCVDQSAAFSQYWVVAERNGYLEWFDPSTQEFGLGQFAPNGTDLFSIGVRGDLVGVF